MEPIITILVTVGTIIAVIAVTVLIIRAVLNSASKRYLGMGFKETADMIGKGLKEESTLPKPISNVSEMYRPKLERDFPHMTYERFIAIANSALLSVFGAVESGNAETLTNVTDALRERVRGIIADNSGRGITEHFDDVKLHRTAVADYKSSDGKAVAVFEISFQCVHYLEGDKKCGKNGKPDVPGQYAASVTLCYGNEFAEETSTLMRSHNCPNCGAPVYSVGGKMLKCRYCGTGITEDIHRSWLADSYKFL